MSRLDDLLKGVEKVSEMGAEANYRVMDNHLKHTDRVIANVMALNIANADEQQLLSVLQEAAENPT